MVGLLPTPNGRQEQLSLCRVFHTNVVALTQLVPSLISFYKKAEKTGGANQYYEKFSIRYNIDTILNFLWKLPQYKHVVTSECSSTDPM